MIVKDKIAIPFIPVGEEILPGEEGSISALILRQT